jgi:hypothetical protein
MVGKAYEGGEDSEREVYRRGEEHGKETHDHTNVLRGAWLHATRRLRRA